MATRRKTEEKLAAGAALPNVTEEPVIDLNQMEPGSVVRVTGDPLIIPRIPTSLYAALLKAKQSISGVAKDARNPHFKSKYASLASVYDAIDEPLADNGLLMLQEFACESGEEMVLVTRIVHVETGQELSSRLIMRPKSTSNPQDAGSLITYMRRYSAVTLLGLKVEDDDGNAASGKGNSSPGNAERQGKRPGPKPDPVTHADVHPEKPDGTSRPVDRNEWADSIIATMRDSEDTEKMAKMRDDLLKRFGDKTPPPEAQRVLDYIAKRIAEVIPF